MVAIFFLSSRSSFWGGWWWILLIFGWLVVACIFLVICNSKQLKIFYSRIFYCKNFYIETNGTLMLVSMEKNEF